MNPTTSNSTYDSVLDMCISSLVSEIRNYAEDQLQSLLNDEDRLNAMVDSMPQVSSLGMDKEMKLAQSKSFAEYNLSIEPKLKEASKKLSETHQKATQLKSEVEALKKQLDAVSENRSLDAVSAILQAVAQEAEDESEAIADKFQEGEKPIEEFIKEYNDKRIQTHLRKIKSEKLLEILRQQQYQPDPASPPGSGLPSRASQLPGYPASGMARHAAYPGLHSGSGASRHSFFR